MIVGWLLVAALCVPARVVAQPVPGATYTGTVDVGGTVTFDVSADGKTVTRFAVADVPGFSCTASTQVTGGTGLYAMTITDDAFNEPLGDFSFLFSGSFPAPQQARGTLNILSSGCIASGNWTASTPTTPPPPKQPRARSAARLTGDFDVTLRVTSSKGVDKKRGDKDSGTWTLTPRCRSGACSVQLHYHLFLGGSVTMRLARHGAVYSGTHTARLAQCLLKDVVGRLRVRLTVTKGAWIGDLWRATRVTGTYRYSFPQTINTLFHVRCPAGSLASTLTGSLPE